MASGFFAILDDIAALMDDVAVSAKLATKKTAGILGDDLAVNAEKATGFLASREVPVLMAIMKGSFVNKLIIVPAVFFLQWLYPPAITIVLVLGGFYLAYEGVEKIVEFLFHRSKHKENSAVEVLESTKNLALEEKNKIQSAVKTDFILSLEIIIIALASAKSSFESLKSKFDPLLVEITTVSIVAIIATVGVYGIVALIVRMDDAGYQLISKSKSEKGLLVSIGNFLVNALPWVIKSLGVIGTIALLMVSGGIFEHNIDSLHHFLPSVPSVIKQILYALLIGTLVLLTVNLFKKVFNSFK